MGRTPIELDPKLSVVSVDGRVLNELCAHARETQPEECCGLVTGNESERFLSVYRCRNDMTLHHRKDPERYPRDGHKAFYMNEVDYLKAQQDAEARGEVVTAIYHSHVGAGAYFSEMDQEFAEHELFPFPDVAHIVIAVWDRQAVQLGLFERDSESGAYRGRRVEVRRV